MNYKLPNGKIKRIPDEDIKRNMRLCATQEEAIQMWLEDEGIEINEEQEALCQKAKETRITQKIHGARANYTPKTQAERVKKDDPTKEGIISAIAKMLEEYEGVCEVVIMNKGKLISFRLGTDIFKIDLVRHRPPKQK